MKLICAISTILLLLVLGACSGSEPSGAEEKEVPLEIYDIRGTVISLTPEDQVAKVEHEDIEGWMNAMTMEFPVKDEAEFAKLKDGAMFEAKVHVRDLDYWLTEIKIVE